MINVKRKGKADKDKFCIKFAPINFEEDSKKIIKIKANMYIFILFVLNECSLFDFNMIKSEIVIIKVTYKGLINRE